VLREVAKAEAERAALLAMMAPSETPASVSPQGPSPEPLIEPTAPGGRPETATAPISWALLNQVNGAVNRAITSQTDLKTYGLTEYWATPLEDGRTAGDCEDYVLEKQRALIASGAPRESLSIAVVTTGWGEAHAVLLVATSQGEFVLDNLTSKIAPWSQAPYHWNMRQLPGQSFQWIMVDNRP
jgi:predicted transglutaminase-like cysteine proteinase